MNSPTDTRSSRLYAFADSDLVRKQVTGLADLIESIDVDDLVDQYLEVKDLAPRRGAERLEFLVPRSGRPTTGRRDFACSEDLLAMALHNDVTAMAVGKREVALLTYQLPLFTSESNAVRAVDLVGHDSGRLVTIELKYPSQRGRGETPVRALLEALIYCAVIEANYDDLCTEVGSKLDLQLSAERPSVVIAAPTRYWYDWTPDARTGSWWNRYLSLTEGLAHALETRIATIDLGDVGCCDRGDGRPTIVGSLNPQSAGYRSA